MSMKLKQLNPMHLLSNAWNPNEVDPVNFDKLKTSIEKDGFARPIIARSIDTDGEVSYEIIGGEHRAAAAVDLGLETVPVIDLGFITDEQAKRFTIIDNTRYGEDDNSKLSQLLSEIGSVEDILATLPIDESELNGYFSHDSLDDELKSLDDLDDLDDPIDLGSTETPTNDTTIIRFKVSQADADAIQRKIIETQTSFDFTESDKLQNAGDALVQLLLGAKSDE